MDDVGVLGLSQLEQYKHGSFRHTAQHMTPSAADLMTVVVLLLS